MRCSVLINTHNHSAYIEECVRSIFAQTRPADEIIAYDDGSADDTAARLRRHAARLTLVEGRHEARPGRIAQAAAIATAFARSTGDLVFLLDGDDRFHPEKIARYADAFAAHPRAVFVQAPMEMIDERGAPLGPCAEPHRHQADVLAAIRRTHDLDWFYPTSAHAYTREFLARVLPLDMSDGLNLWPDSRLALLAALHGVVVTLPDALTDWRRHRASDSVLAQSRSYLLDLTRVRTRFFNARCGELGVPPLSLWRNARFYRQLARRWLPASLSRAARPPPSLPRPPHP